MEISKMNIDEISERREALKDEVEKAEKIEDITKLKEEREALNLRANELKEKEELRQANLNDISLNNKGAVLSAKGEKMETKSFGIETVEYRNAFLKDLLNMDLTVEERAAFTATTSNTGAVLPTTMLNQIWSNIEEQHSILGDITIYRTGTILEVIKHTAVAAGDAAITAEGVEATDEQNTFATVTLSGKDFVKTVRLSYAEMKMSVAAFEGYLVNEISERIGYLMAKDVVSQIGTDIAIANKVETATVAKIAYADVAGTFSLLKNVQNVKVYCSQKTLYANLVAMVDTSGKPIFQPSAQAGAMGTLIGGLVKVEDAVADGTLLIGDPTKFVYNMIQDIMVEQDRDIAAHKHIISGYARGEGTLTSDVAFAELSLKVA